ncbi:class D sortase [Candidatus Saccharibacteria bacterium]|nr:class D sortase [Candidatus Saccharibacteria bacterium]
MDTSSSHNSSGSNQSLPLPDEPAHTPDPPEQQANLAADLIRQKVSAAYKDEPDVAEEALDLQELGSIIPHSRHQQFIYDLTGSGKSLPEIQAAWHEYYTGLPDQQKHQVWQEFYSSHAQTSSYGGAAAVGISANPSPITDQQQINVRSLGDLRNSITKNLPSQQRKLKPLQHAQSLLFGIGVGSIVVMFFLFGFFNERFVAPFIQPSRSVTGTPIISSNTASGIDPEIIIPKINVEIPVVYGVSTVEESKVQQALERGVVHYANTAKPGEQGNAVIVGHSSNNIFNGGKYKFAFVLLSRLENKDIFYLEKDGKRYTYEVYEKRVVKPTELSVLGEQAKPSTVTLITCDPPGTSTNRLVVIGQQISPDPSTNLARSEESTLATSAKVIPSNAPTLWSRIFAILSR